MNEFTLLGEFADPEAETAFQEAKWPETRRRMCYVCGLTALAYLGAIALDWLQMPPGTARAAMTAARIIASCLGGLAVLFTLPATGNARRLGWALGAYMLAVLLAESLELALTSGRSETQGVPACVIIVLTYYLFLPPRVLPALIAGPGGSLAYLLTLAFLPAPAVRVIYVGLFLALVNSFGVYFLTRFGLSQRSERQAFLKLKELAEIDPLTQVYTRRRVLELAERALRQALRYDEPFSVLYLDIDRFKDVNDRFGHGVGDAVLTAVAASCRMELREVDLFGRLGGEEFVIFLLHSGLPQAMTVAERVRAAVAGATVPAVGGAPAVTASIGVTELTADAADLDALLGRADQALYRAKREGRNRACAWQDGRDL